MRVHARRQIDLGPSDVQEALGVGLRDGTRLILRQHVVRGSNDLSREIIERSNTAKGTNLGHGSS